MRLKKLLLIGALTCAAASVMTGCAYRSDLAQGNFVEQDAVNKLRQGMTPEQVRFILGTPMLTDPFDNTRWYYVHFLRKGWSDPKIQNLVVLFQGRALYDVAGDFKKPVDFYSQDKDVSKINLGDVSTPASAPTQAQTSESN